MSLFYGALIEQLDWTIIRSTGKQLTAQDAKLFGACFETINSRSKLCNLSSRSNQLLQLNLTQVLGFGGGFSQRMANQKKMKKQAYTNQPLSPIFQDMAIEGASGVFRTGENIARSSAL